MPRPLDRANRDRWIVHVDANNTLPWGFPGYTGTDLRKRLVARWNGLSNANRRAALAAIPAPAAVAAVPAPVPAPVAAPAAVIAPAAAPAPPPGHAHPPAAVPPAPAIGHAHPPPAVPIPPVAGQALVQDPVLAGIAAAALAVNNAGQPPAASNAGDQDEGNQQDQSDEVNDEQTGAGDDLIEQPIGQAVDSDESEDDNGFTYVPVPRGSRAFHAQLGDVEMDVTDIDMDDQGGGWEVAGMEIGSGAQGTASVIRRILGGEIVDRVVIKDCFLAEEEWSMWTNWHGNPRRRKRQHMEIFCVSRSSYVVLTAY